MEKLQRYFDAIEAELSKIEYAAEPDGLYAPVRYELSLGGKRVRPLLTLLACEMFAGDYRRALNAAVGLEVFHNFTLLHDDVMDKADVRRGKPTVHKVWDENTAILSGDAMEIIAFRYIARTEAPHTGAVVELFLKTALEICEGQQMDMDFEQRSDVKEEEYLEMIRLKTSVLLAASLKIGALLGGASAEDAERLYDFGMNMGVAFQLKDDLLDVYGDTAVFGKNIGGDILCNKKTYMLIKALEHADKEQAAQLKHWITVTDFDPAEKIEAVTGLYNRIGVKLLCENKMSEYNNKALESLAAVNVTAERKRELDKLIKELMYREV